MAVPDFNRESEYVVGNIRLVSRYRHFGNDQGPSLEVFWSADGRTWTKVVRYDCFRAEPHRHIFHADGRDERVVPWGRGGTEGAISATAAELHEGLGQVLLRAGLVEAAGKTAHGGELDPIVEQVAADLRRRELASV
jgi:hypothetical protein